MYSKPDDNRFHLVDARKRIWVRAWVGACAVWKSGRGSRLLLLDSDATTRRSADGWKQLNTLAHYNVPNNSTFVLVNRRLTEGSLDGSSPVTRTVNGTKR